MSKILDSVRALAEPECEKLGLELWDAEYVREAGQWFLRLYIDKAGGVSINDCEALSRAVDPLLDEADPIPGSYTFEVSSAGLDRELKTGAQFLRFIGSPVELRLYEPFEGSKSHAGTLSAYENGDVTILTPGGERRFEKARIAQTRLHLE